MIKGISFDNQVLTAKLLRMILAGYGDGILSGCAISYSGKTVTIGTGAIIAAGGAFQIASAESVTVNATSGYARIKAVINTNGTATATAFNQVSFAVDTATSPTAFPAMTKQDINNSGTTYEMEICVLSCDTSGVTGIHRTAPNPRAILDSSMFGTSLPNPGIPGRVFFKKV